MTWAPASIWFFTCAMTARVSTSISTSNCAGCSCMNLRVSAKRSPRLRAVDHVAGQRPGRAGKTDQRLFRRQRCLDAGDGLVDRRQAMLEVVEHRSRRAVLAGHQRLQHRALALAELDLAAQRVRDHQDVGEHDGGVEVEAADRLQGHFHRQFRGVAEIEEMSRPGSAARGIPADSGRPGASARSAAAASARHVKTQSNACSILPFSIRLTSSEPVFPLFLLIKRFIGSSSSRACAQRGFTASPDLSPGYPALGDDLSSTWMTIR